MKRTLIAILVCVAIIVWQPAAADAHQPQLVSGDYVKVPNPEVSKAYYDTLAGAPRTYVIDSPNPFHLYLNLLVPGSSNPQGRYSAIVYTVEAGNRTESARLDAGSVEWKEFYEEYGGDYYLWGPEYEQDVPEGRYEVEVYGNGNLGKYVLAVGKLEEFPPLEIARTFLVLPVLKMQFFQYPPLTLLASPYILAWLIIIAVVLLAIGLVLVRVCRRRPKSLRPGPPGDE
jgi:hypothetical protein